MVLNAKMLRLGIFYSSYSYNILAAYMLHFPSPGKRLVGAYAILQFWYADIKSYTPKSAT